MRWRLAALSLVALLLWGCDDDRRADAASDASASATTAEPEPDRARALREAELTRSPAAVTADDLASRDVAVRRAAARALARAQSPLAREGLLRLLSDEDETVAAWAAYGLGDHCTGHRDSTVSALVAAASSRAGDARDAGASGAPSAHRAIARAVGRCAAPASEATLVGWARRRDAHAVDAIHALGDVATQHGKLREETFVALLELAAGNAANPPLADALYPFGRVEHLPPSVIERTREVAKARLGDKGNTPARLYAVRALARSDEAAVPLLELVLRGREAHDPAERAEAARGLGRLGRKGQRALAAAVDELVPQAGLSKKQLLSPETGVLLAALGAITDTGGGARATLARIAALAPPEPNDAALVRRVSSLRCAAAALVAERNYELPLLLGCDLSVPADKRRSHPLPAGLGARAVVTAIGVDGVKIRGQRLQAWRTYATAGDARTREAALEIIGRHDEIREAPEILAEALGAEQPGVVGTAAGVVREHPDRVMVKTKKGEVVHAKVKKALLAALAGKEATRDHEALAEVISAAGALGLADAKDRLLALCSSPHVVLREKSHAALARLLGGAAKVKCKPPPPLALPVELARAASTPIELTLETDVGELGLELDPALAPIAVTRAAELAEKGFYDGMVVHRVVPAFVTQFGSPTHDGYGGAPDRLPLPCETSPLPFDASSVGVALAGRDTGSSQLFVTHVATPHLDGRYPLIGRASGAWNALVAGDVIRKVRVSR